MYQAYEYKSSADAEPSAYFTFDIAADLDCDISAENIKNTWEDQFDPADQFDVRPAESDIFTQRVEFKNKNVHRIAYLTQIDESELFQCAIELYSPNKRKKLDETLSAMFEEFAKNCRYK